MVQWLGLPASTDEGLGSIPRRQTKIPTSHVAWPKEKKKNTKKLFFKLKTEVGKTSKGPGSVWWGLVQRGVEG